VSLLDPQGNTLSEVEYSSTQENFSYSFTGSTYQWTKKVTPGAENEFSKNPKITLKQGEEGYVDIPLLFKTEVKNAKKPYKYSWDFGDGRRSTLAEPKHTFTKTGKYKASVTLRSESGTAEKEFTINIKKYPKQSVFITALMANPEGKDSGIEWVEIKNAGEKNINLTDWKLATGSEDPVNHPFLQEVILHPDQTLRLTRRHAAFSLPNENGTVELRYPNNEAASTTRYEEETIAENDTCTNVNGRCDFKASTTKKKENEGKKDEQVAGAIAPLKETDQEAPSLPTKKEILQRMGTDFNLLMNQIIQDSLLKGN
jgi:PKD repeat protein